jgi:RecA/RadA recombinase
MSLDAILKNRGMMTLEEYEELINNRTFISTGYPELDRLIQDNPPGGIPRNCITEVYGMSAVGKSRFVKNLCAQPNVKALYIDTENSLPAEELKWLKDHGVDCISENVIETIWGVTSDILDDPDTHYDLIVVDSLAAMVSNVELAADNEQTMSTVLAQAKAMTMWMKQLIRKLNGSNTAFVFVNHKKIAPGVIHSVNTPGGASPKFYSSLRLDFKASKKDLKGTVQKVEVEIAKSRFSSKNTTVKIPLELDYHKLDIMES